MKPIRILQIVGGMNMGGIENFLMNIYRNLDRERVQFDFFIHNDVDAIFEDEIRELGGKVFKILHVTKSGHKKYVENIREFFKNHKEYKVIHCHRDELNGLVLKIAKEEGIKVRISHSHNAYPKYNSFIGKLYKNYYLSKINRYATEKYACSKIAGEWMYGKRTSFEVIKNGIEVKKYLYNEDIRKIKRQELELNEKDIVIGHIGRFVLQKNHMFLLEIFRKLVDRNKEYKLLLIGNGELEKEVINKIEELKLEENVKVLGVRKDVNEILQAMDMFLLPSFHEGLPVTLVEAQGAGLKCFISNTVTKEIDLECGLTEFISLNSSSEEWAEIIDKNRVYIRKDTIESLKSHGYDMTENAKNLENRYIELYNKV
jgi:glycosyltransferase involved in cell wall biosynthesis